jgi:hypothetical protein
MIGATIHLRWNDNDNPQYYLANLRMACQNLGVTDFIIIDQTKYKMGSYFTAQGFNIHTFDRLEECEEHFKNDAEFIYLEPNTINPENNISLHDFEHPDSAIYVVASNFSSISTIGRENKKWTYIPMAVENAGFYAETAIVIALYDRSFKTWQ